MIFSHLNSFAFILAFGAGVLAVYMLNPKPHVVVKFPTPMNAGKVVYREDAECYRYDVEEVDCDSYDSLRREQPLPSRSAPP